MGVPVLLIDGFEFTKGPHDGKRLVRLKLEIGDVSIEGLFTLDQAVQAANDLVRIADWCRNYECAP